MLLPILQTDRAFIMKHILYFIFCLSSIYPFVASSGCLPDDPPHTENFYLNKHINSQRFVRHIADTVDNKVMGYVAILRGKDGSLLAAIEHGWAKTPCEDGIGLPYTKNTISSWASVTKVVTAATILNKINRFWSRSLDERLIDHFPDGWVVGDCYIADNCWSDAQIRHALSHRAGFDKSINTPWPDRFLSGESEKPIGERSYTNDAFSIWHYLGSFLAAGKMADAETSYTMSDGDYTQYIFDATRQIWKDYLNNQIAKKAGIKLSCGDVDFNGDNFALIYDDPNDETQGYQPNSVDTPNCTSGGMVMSANSMSKFYHTLVNTDRILSPSFFSDTMQIAKPELMGFDGREEMQNGEFSYQKNGGARGGRIAADTMYFTDGLTAVIVRNSKKQDDLKWRKLLTDAYNSGMETGTGVLQNPY